MDARQLKLFLAVLDSPTMTRAAERVHLSTAAVSLQLRALAEELKTDLFVRNGKHLVPTPAARRLEEHARRVVDELEAIDYEFKNAGQTDARPFHLATGATTLIYRLGEPLRLLRARYPSLDLHITVADTEAIVAGVLDRQFDLGLISLPFPIPDLRIVPLFDEEMLLLRPTVIENDGSRVRSIQPSELNGAPMLLYPRNNMRTLIDDFFHRLQVTPQVIMEAANTEILKCLVEAGSGYSMLPEFALRSSVGFFETLRVAGHRLFRKQALAMAQTSRHRALTEGIASFLKEQLNRPQPRRVPDAGRCSSACGK